MLNDRENDIKLLEENDWIVECESPFEIRYSDGGAFATGLAAQIVLDDLKHERDNAFSEQDMSDCFHAGVNRGVGIAGALINRRIYFLDGTQTYKEYIKKFEE